MTEKSTPGTRFKFSIFILLLLSLQLALITCRHHETINRDIEPSPSQVKEPLIKANKEAVLTENEQINDFLRRYQWHMTETGSGLRYMVYQHGNGPKVEAGDLVKASYITSLLNGDTVYTSQESGPMVFVAGKAEVVSGLEEGILLLQQGDRAKFIIPSHLAFGLIGDQDKIGQKMTLVYDIQILETDKKN